jgi:hypothetical protein
MASGRLLVRLQALLNFEGCVNQQFSKKTGNGRIGVAGFLLGTVFGLHLAVVLAWVLQWPVRLWLVSAPTRRCVI